MQAIWAGVFKPHQVPKLWSYSWISIVKCYRISLQILVAQIDMKTQCKSYVLDPTLLPHARSRAPPNCQLPSRVTIAEHSRLLNVHVQGWRSVVASPLKNHDHLLLISFTSQLQISNLKHESSWLTNSYQIRQLPTYSTTKIVCEFESAHNKATSYLNLTWEILR